MRSLLTVAAVGMLGALVATTAIAPAASNPVVASARGAGQDFRPDGTLRSFSFAAQKRADGTVTGQLQLNSRSFDVFVHIEIDCLRVEDDTAYMSGRVTFSSNLAEGVPGELNRWAVRDNGERSGAQLDTYSTIPANTTGQDTKTCMDDMSDRPLTRVAEHGDIQVSSG